MSGEARIGFVGDVMLGRLVSPEIRSRPPQDFWGDVQPLLHSCAAVIANLECAITTHTKQWTRTEKVFHFGADPAAVDVLKAGNIKAVSLANNHVLDFEVEGLTETLDRLDHAGISHAGAGRNEADARKPALFTAGGRKIALFSCVDHEKPFAATKDRPGVAYIDLTVQPSFPDAGEIAGVRRSGADFIVLSCHLGPNMALRPSQQIRDFRHAAAGRGVDIVHGHSAHLFQGVEMVARALILHDAGDFLDDYAVDGSLRNDWSFVFVVEVDAAGPRTLTLHPVTLEFARVRRATAVEAKPMFERMIELSAELGTHMERDGDYLSLRLPRETPQ